MNLERLHFKFFNRVWNLKVDGYTYGGEIAKWLSKYLEKDNLDLACFGDDLAPRKVKDIDEKSNLATEDDVTIYNDYSPYMLIGEGSLADLNSKLEKKVQMKNFRPNFIVKGTPAFAEVNLFKFIQKKLKKIKNYFFYRMIGTILVLEVRHDFEKSSIALGKFSLV